MKTLSKKEQRQRVILDSIDRIYGKDTIVSFIEDSPRQTLVSITKNISGIFPYKSVTLLIRMHNYDVSISSGWLIANNHTQWNVANVEQLSKAIITE